MIFPVEWKCGIGQSLLWLEAWVHWAEENRVKSQAAGSSRRSWRAQTENLQKEEGHVSLRQKLTMFMSWTQLVVSVLLYGKAHEDPVMLRTHQGKRKRNYRSRFSTVFDSVGFLVKGIRGPWTGSQQKVICIFSFIFSERWISMSANSCTPYSRCLRWSFVVIQT